MSITFEVDRVARATQRAPERPIASAVTDLVGRPVFTSSCPASAVLKKPGLHPFAAAIHHAFAEHRPLILSPDAVWLTIAQGFSQHVNQDPKALRSHLVRHEGKRTITREVGMLTSQDEWARAIEGLCEELRKDLAPGVSDWVRNDFSTSTQTTRVAGDIVLLESYQRYYRYCPMYICGIPEVTLLGTPADWREIERRVELLAPYDLEWWTDLLLPVCRELRRSAEGDVDLIFWKSICMPEEVYGGEDVTGWMIRFFPYLDGIDEQEMSSVEMMLLGATPGDDSELPATAVRNPGLAPWSGEAKFSPGRRLQPPPPLSTRKWLCEGVPLRHLPLGVSSVPFELVSQTEDDCTALRLFAGFMGVSQSDTLALQPEIGWGVAEGSDALVTIEDWS